MGKGKLISLQHAHHEIRIVVRPARDMLARNFAPTRKIERQPRIAFRREVHFGEHDAVRQRQRRFVKLRAADDAHFAPPDASAIARPAASIAARSV